MIAALSLCGLMTACGSDDDPQPEPIRIPNQTVEFPQQGGTQDVVVFSAGKPTVKPDADWVTASFATVDGAGPNGYAIRLTAASNESEAERSTLVRISCGLNFASVKVIQAGTVATEPDPDPEPEPTGDYIEPVKSGMEHSAMEIAKAMKVGFNVGNTLEAIGGETAWGNPMLTQDLFNAVKAAGFDAVRIPVAWNEHAKDGVIDAAWMDRVQQVVDYAMSANLYAVVNIHWDGGWLETKGFDGTGDEEKINELQAAYWKQIALRFRGYDEHLLFAGCNEPNADNAAKMKKLARYEQTFVDAVRATGGRNHWRTLIVQGPNTDVNKTQELFGAMPTDVVEGRMMAEVHYYDPYQFCLMEKDEDWGNTFWFWGKDNKAAATELGLADRWSTWGDEAYVASQMAKMKKKFVDAGYPVIIGEFGALTDWSGKLADNEKGLELHRKSRYDHNFCVAKEAINAGCVPFLWDTGAAISRSTGKVSCDWLAPAVIAGAAAASYPY